MDDEDLLVEDLIYKLCNGMHYACQCLCTCTNLFMSKVLQFKQNLRNWKQAIDNSNGDKYVSTHLDDDIIFKEIGPSLLNVEAITKYYNELDMLDESKIHTGDFVFCDEFKMLKMIHLKKVE